MVFINEKFSLCSKKKKKKDDLQIVTLVFKKQKYVVLITFFFSSLIQEVCFSTFTQILDELLFSSRKAKNDCFKLSSINSCAVCL
jgi:hypothetical protein